MPLRGRTPRMLRIKIHEPTSMALSPKEPRAIPIRFKSIGMAYYCADKASRKPMLLLRFVGALLLRFAERQFPASLFELPPRSANTVLNSRQGASFEPLNETLVRISPCSFEVFGCAAIFWSAAIICRFEIPEIILRLNQSVKNGESSP